MITPYIFDGGILTAGAVAQGTVVPALTRRIIKSASIVNTTAAVVNATVYLVPAGGAANATSTMISARPIAQNETYPCNELILQGINAGGSVQALGLGLTFKYTAVDIV